MYKLIFKRLLDFLLSLLGLVVLSPIFVIFMVIGRIKMKGNPFFCQERPGKNGKIFKLIKFRSMTEEKDENGNYLPDEVRLTPYGEWLRNSSIDEIPELINILKGDMSIVGPRPLLVQYLPLYSEEQAHRHDVRPGLTGLAQINGRANLLWKEKFAYDVDYVKNISFLNDLKILFKTIVIVFKRDNVKNDELGSWYPFLGDEVEDPQTPILKEKHKEIGSEFVSIPISTKNDFFPKETKWFNSGREALSFIINDIKNKTNVKTAALPFWCCDSMIKPFIDRNIDVIFYDKKTMNNNSLNADILLNMNYFGYENELLNFDGIVINDITHSVFMKNTTFNAEYTFGSLRKWAAFKTGGFAYSKDGFKKNIENNINEKYISLRQQAMKLKDDYLNGISTKKDYLNIFAEAEKMLEQNCINSAYNQDIEYANKLDIAFIRNKRRENANELLKGVKEYAIYKEVKENDCPMFVPIIVPNGKRDELRKLLINNKIYCPVHWPISKLHKLTEDEKYIYDNELSLVCDQRYGIEDMKKITGIITKFFKEDKLC